MCEEDMLIELGLASILAWLVACKEAFEKEEEPLEAMLFYHDWRREHIVHAELVIVLEQDVHSQGLLVQEEGVLLD